MYIRTKDNAIYEIVNGNIIIGNLEVQIDSRKAIEEGNIIADSIEKLCDGFYNDILNDFDCFGFDGLYIYNDFESFKEDWKAYRVHDNWEGDGYGFIKTSKGLIYVAKMNLKGELELCRN